MQKRGKKTDLEILADLPVLVDFILLQDCFSRYKSPKKKIFDLKMQGYLQQIKRGQYFNLKSKAFEFTPYEVIANSLYYPSYVSMEWALQYYGVIPERVKGVTSVTLLRSKIFKTVYAPFFYWHLSKNRYAVGYGVKLNDKGESFLIAGPEKALLDYISVKAKNLKITDDKDIRDFLKKDMRLDLDEFLKIVKTEDLDLLLSFYHRNSKEYKTMRWLLKQKGGRL